MKGPLRVGRCAQSMSDRSPHRLLFRWCPQNSGAGLQLHPCVICLEQLCPKPKVQLIMHSFNLVLNEASEELVRSGFGSEIKTGNDDGVCSRAGTCSQAPGDLLP